MKIKNTICLLLLLAGISSCYKDKGNYNYSELLEITIDSIQESYGSYALIDTLRIRPKISPENLEYDYWWGVYETNVQGYAPQLDTLYYTRDLEMPMTLSPGTYSLVFCAKEKSTGVAGLTRASLTVVTTLSEGWYVLRSQNGYTDLDLFTGNNKIENVIATNNEGRQLKGEATALSHLSAYKSWDEANSRYVNTNTLFALSNEDMVALRVNEGTIIRSFEDLFYNTPDVAAPQDIYGGFTDLYMMNNGKMYTIYNMSSNSGRFGEPKGGDYKLSPYRVHNGIRYPLLYDENSCSFCSADTWDNLMLPLKDEGPVDSIPLPPVNNMDADLLFMGPTSSSCAYALMKKKQEDLYLLFNLNADCYTPYNNPIQTWDTLDNSLGLLQADRWATNTANHIIYYAIGNTIYSCNVDGGYQERVQQTLPAGEEITYMRHLTYSVYNDPSVGFDYMAVASFNGANYKVYFFELQAGNLQNDPEILEGEGKVGALMYVNGTGGTSLR